MIRTDVLSPPVVVSDESPPGPAYGSSFTSATTAATMPACTHVAR